MTLDCTAIRRLLAVSPIKLVLYSFSQTGGAAPSCEFHSLFPGRRVRAGGWLRTGYRLRLNDDGMVQALVSIARGICGDRPIVHQPAGRITFEVQRLAE